jgi:hypothetical protein
MPGDGLVTSGQWKNARRLAQRGTPLTQLMLHKNTVQYRIRKAKEILDRPVGENRYHVKLALRASHWLGSSMPQPAAGHDHNPRERAH